MDDCCVLTAVQLELIEEAKLPVRPKIVHADVTARDTALRRAVQDAIVQLSEIVSEGTLRILLPFLHCGAWDEMVEERYLGHPRLCGFPLCGEVIEARMIKQRYHIDRVARKIYEHRIETDMYCSRSCLMRSASVRSQLPAEPLWLSGDISRLTSLYRTDGPDDLDDGQRKEIEIISAEEEQISELKIREADSSTESEDNDESETDVKGFLDEVADIIGAEELEKSRKESKIITSKVTPKSSPGAKTGDQPPKLNTSSKLNPEGNLIHVEGEEQNLKSNTSSSVTPNICVKSDQPSTKLHSTSPSSNSNTKTSSKASVPAYNPRLPDPQMADNVTFSNDELQKIARLRSKYKKNWDKKKPIIVDPAPVSPSSSEKISEENVGATCQSTAATSTSSSAEPEFVNNVRELFRSWVTDRTRQLLRSGGLSVSGEVDSVMKQFYRPYSDDVAEMNDRVLPDVDSIDIRRKRLHIFLDSTKKQMTTYQRELGVPTSETNWHYMVAATFDLEPNTVTDFTNRVLKLTCCLLLRLVSLLDTSVEDAIYPGGKASAKLVQLLTEMNVDTRVFDDLVSEIVSEEKS